MKTITIKIPINIAQLLDDRGQLNPQYLGQFLNMIVEYKLFNMDNKELYNPIEGLTMSYAFKIDSALHTILKDSAKHINTPLGEYAGRILSVYYK